MLVSQNNEISKLSNVINELNSSITCLTETIKALQPSVTSHSSTNTDTNSTTQPEPSHNKVPDHAQEDRKFNVVVYGIKECDKGTPRHERLKHDVENVTQIATEGENSISPLSI